MSTTIAKKPEVTLSRTTNSIEVNRANLQRMLKCYPADRQVKYLHLQAEIDVLIQHLQTIKKQK